MKQVVFAIALLAMASLTGCLNTDDTSVDENTDTTSDGTNQDETINPVGSGGGYSPPETANISWEEGEGTTEIHWVAKDGNRITTSCFSISQTHGVSLVIYDSDDRIIYLANGANDYGAKNEDCSSGSITIDVTLGPEPVKVGLTRLTSGETNHFSWIVTF